MQYQIEVKDSKSKPRCEPFAGNDRFQCSQLPVGLVATTVHLAPRASWLTRMRRSAGGAPQHGHHPPTSHGKSTAISRTVGTLRLCNSASNDALNRRRKPGHQLF